MQFSSYFDRPDLIFDLLLIRSRAIELHLARGLHHRWSGRAGKIDL